MMERLLLLGITFVSSLVAFVLGLHVFFPDHAVLDRVTWEVQDRSRDRWAFTASDVDLWMLTGLRFQDVVLYKRSPYVSTRPGADPAISQVVAAQDLVVRVPIARSLTMDRLLDFDASVFGGHLSGRGGMSGKRMIAQLQTDDVQVAMLPIEGESWSVDLGGTLHLDVDLAIDTEDVDQSEGHIHFEIASLALQGGEAFGSDISTILGDAIPAAFTEAKLEFEVKDGQAEVTTGTFHSDPVQIEVGGSIHLNKDITRCRFDLEITLTFDEKLDQLARLALSSARDNEGKYHFKISGTVLRPSFREDRSAARGRSTSRSSASEDRTPEDDAARQERIERLRERREKMRAEREAAKTQRDDARAADIEPPHEPLPDLEDLPSTEEPDPNGMGDERGNFPVVLDEPVPGLPEDLAPEGDL